MNYCRCISQLFEIYTTVINLLIKCLFILINFVVNGNLVKYQLSIIITKFVIDL